MFTFIKGVTKDSYCSTELANLLLSLKEASDELDLFAAVIERGATILNNMLLSLKEASHELDLFAAIIERGE